MNVKESVKLAAKTGKKWLVKYAPEVLTGASVGLSVAAVVLTVPATMKAEDLIARERLKLWVEMEKKHDDGAIVVPDIPDDVTDVPELTKLETVKLCWTCYIPTALALGGSITCAILSNRISATRIAALATAYGLSEKKLKEYQGKVKELFGEEKEKQVHDEMNKDSAAMVPINQETMMPLYYPRFAGDYLCMDAVTGRYFRSTQEKLRRAFLDLDKRLLVENRISLNEFFDDIGLPECEMGNILGWMCGNYNDLPEPAFTTIEHPQTGEPCLVVDYDVYPLADFRVY